ncbi:UbiA prenyltransferase family protein [Dactylosporangium fulvum]|uniref:UbiA prenyltransferase family protein n=1 Tax=Dactylosporangium fulvum TaxID=53359 RepID=A0ABY5W9Z7_9ACTN|nr:UbiA prenyltransferase family protein [Dactylosporangium fulvum]UWP86210.1 UbiA prenyltransferase family protein [Dactylosporangium fulvum]
MGEVRGGRTADRPRNEDLPRVPGRTGAAGLPGAAVRERLVGRFPAVAPVWTVVHLTRPWFWPLGWAGAYLGAVLATRAWLPPVTPATVALLVALGPLVWGAVLAVNDLHDLPSDRRNPRKATAALVTGAITEAELARWARRCTVAALAVAAVAGWWALAGTALVLLLGYLYSAPPWRLKARAGADVAVNALTVGVLGPLAGWSLHRSPLEYPSVMVLLGLLLGAALYLPTTVIDVDADRAAGDPTSAVRWTPEGCYRLGFALWTAAVLVWLATCHLGLLVTRAAWPLQDAAAPVLVLVYALLTLRPSIARMAVVSAAFAVPAADFLLACVA